MSETIVFFGNERLATGVHTSVLTLQKLINAGYRVAAVVSNYEKGRSRSARPLEIAEVAAAHDIPLLLPEKPLDIRNQLESYGAEIGILVAYGKIVPQSVIHIFPKGIVNIHPSLLPLHRGPTPIESVILGGARKTGVSIMSLVHAMDAGPVYGQSEIKLNGTETKQVLAEELLDIGGSMLLELLPGILNDTLIALPQDNSQATYDQLIKPTDGVIDWSKTAEQLQREVRAYAEWPKSRAVLAGKEVIITKASVAGYEIHGTKITPGHVFPTPDGLIGVAASQGVLVIERLKPAGKREMSAKEFLAGNKLP